MESKVTKTEKVIMGVCIGVLIFFMFTIMVRFFTRQILTNHFGISNAFTEFVWFDMPSLNQVSSEYVDIDWEKLYPFDTSKNNIESNSMVYNSNKVENYNLVKKINQIRNTVFLIEDKISIYATDQIIFYSNFIEAANVYELCIGWNFSPYDEYNSVVIMPDDYLTVYVEEKDVTQDYEALSELNDFCQSRQINFLYVQAPYKISEYDDTDVSGVLDFSNQNADSLLSMLDASGIDYYDIRETIHENNINNHELFYKTDHHWLTTTGLWAAQNILTVINERYGWNTDTSLLDGNQFDYTVYKDWFLGSRGQKLTLARCKPDDFTLLYPKYETSFHYSVPNRGIDTVGDYSVVYDMSAIEVCDYYNKSPYLGCNYSDCPLIQIENTLTGDEHKILMIGDSFDNCAISCVALAVKNVDSIDLRYFSGSLKAYIEESNPDLVIVMYNPDALGGEIDYSSNLGLFNFR
jgi:hypothetical protein